MKTITLLLLLGLASDSSLALQYHKTAMAAQERLNRFGNLDAIQNQVAFDQEEQLHDIETAKTAWKNQVRQYALLGGLGIVLLITFLLYRTNRQRRKANAVLQEQKEKMEQANQYLKAAHRETQIEAALERVRAASLAMQHSEELRDVAFVLVSQLDELGVQQLGITISISDEKMERFVLYGANNNLKNDEKVLTITKSLDGDAYYFSREFRRLVVEGKKEFSLELRGENLQEWIAHVKREVNRERGMRLENAGLTHLFFHAALFHEASGIVISSLEPISKENGIILRKMAQAFGISYRRFLDLQKAEARALEAARAASLDRVRAEIASMRRPDDLQRITPLIWRELTTLGVPFFRCGVFIVDEAAERLHAYLSTPDGHPLGVLHLPFDGAETTRKTVDHWRRGEVYTDFWDRQQFLAWVRSMTEQGFVRESAAYQGGEEPPESLALQFVPFNQGMLYVGSAEPLPEVQISLLQRLADTFAVAYARYEDFIKLEEAKNRVESTLTELKATQAQLIQQEKLASLGQLTAGIAHEIKNPLNFVNNFSEVSRELLTEMREEIKKGDWAEVEAIVGDLEQNLEKIHRHGNRADAIVQAMFLHARGGSGLPEPTDLNAFVKKYVHLAYHGMRAGNDPINVTIDLDLDEQAGTVPLVVEDFSRVILNLCQNAFDAMRSRWQSEAEQGYQPRLRVATRRSDGPLAIEVTDNGPGIPEAIREKIFQPFFTTKKGTEGTGLGLSIAHDIVKAHGGTLKVENVEENRTVFIVQLPVQTKE